MDEVKKIAPVDTDLEFDDIDDSDDEIEVLDNPDSPEIPETFQSMLNKYKEQSNNYVDLRLLKLSRQMNARNEEVDARFEKIEDVLDAHAQLFKDIAQATPITVQQIPGAIQQQATAQPEEHPTEKANPVAGIVNGTLGTVGGVLHGVVDTAAFVLESVVDLVTLGKARRT